MVLRRKAQHDVAMRGLTLRQFTETVYPPAAVTRYRFLATPQFWRSYKKLTDAQMESARQAWKIFQVNPYDPRLRTHKIASLSARFIPSGSRAACAPCFIRTVRTL